MLYTRKGDDGTTKTFGCNQRISKSSAVAEALGALDETNSFLGLARARTEGKSFDISGATKDGAVFDITRTLARRAERRVIAAKEEGKITVSAETLQYLNRLSSLLYALARIASHIEGVEEIKPDYK